VSCACHQVAITKEAAVGKRIAIWWANDEEVSHPLAIKRRRANPSALNVSRTACVHDIPAPRKQLDGRDAVL
jgi:hypothetical protein